MIKPNFKTLGTVALIGLLAGCGTNKQVTAATAAATDTTPPVITAFTTTPSVLTSSAERVVLLVSATDNVAPTKVEFYRVLSGGSTPVVGLVFTDTSAPYSNAFAFSSSLQNGTYGYMAKAYDAAGNVSVAKQMSYRVDIPCTSNCVVPTLSLTASPNILKNIGTTTLAATSNAKKVDFYRVQGSKESFLFTDTTAPFELPFRFSSDTQNGTYSYKAIALSSTGSNTTATVSFVVDMDTTAPKVSLVASNTNIVTPETLTLTASASDNVGITKVAFYTDGGDTFLGEDTTAPYTYSANITSANNGSTSYTAYAYDAANNMAYAIPYTKVNVAIPAPGFQLLPDISMFEKTASISSRSLARGSDGQPLMAWGEYDGMSLKLYIKRWNGTQWVQVGTQALNVTMDTSANEPALAIDGTGNPVVTWYECDGNAICNVYVKRWNGSSWVLLGDGPLDIVVENSASTPNITIDGNTGYPVVAWLESGWQVKRWNGTAWVLLSGTSTSSAADSKAPVVAWTEPFNGANNLYLRRWNGTGWVVLGGALNTISSRSAVQSSFALDTNGNPVVAWAELNGSNAEVYIKRWNGASWVSLGGMLNIGSNTTSCALSLALDANGNPVVAWCELDGAAYDTQLYVKRWNGTAWVLVGDGALDMSKGDNVNRVSVITDTGGNPVVAWTEFDDISKYRVWIKKFNP